MNYENVLRKNWKTLANKKVDLVESLRPYILEENLVIHVGTDAQKSSGKDNNDFVTCVCIHNMGHGGRIFYAKDRNVKIKSMWEKLYGETMLSLSCAVELSNVLPSLEKRIIVHVDANPNTKYESSNYVKQLAGMVMSYGFRYILKPDSWASSHCADHLVKGKNNK